jgi:hypothetical protein
VNFEHDLYIVRDAGGFTVGQEDLGDDLSESDWQQGKSTRKLLYLKPRVQAMISYLMAREGQQNFSGFIARLVKEEYQRVRARIKRGASSKGVKKR